MPKILLCALNAKYIHSNPAVYILKSYSKEYSDHIEIKEYTINQNMEDILADIYKSRPSVIAFSCYIWNWEMIRRLIREIPKILPGCPIWLGGPEVSYDAPTELASNPEVTGIIVGEGEETFKELVRHYVRLDIAIEDIKGLCIRDELIHFTGIREKVDINSIPFFYDNLSDFENRIIYYESSRGCPYRCSYCLSSIDKKLRIRSLDLVKKELAFFIDKQVPQVKFIDRTFNCNHNHAMEVWRYITEHDNGITNFHFEISADIITDEELELMSKMRPGLIQLEIGVQSTNTATIEEINRSMNLDKLKRVVSIINSFGNIHQHLDLIAGLPFEDLSSFKESFNEVYLMRPNQLQLGFLKILKGSPMEERAKEYGIKYQSQPPYEVLSTNWLSYEEVLILKQVEAMLELYHNSGQFVNTLRLLEKAFDTPFSLYLALAKYYEENGYYINKPARSYRYEVLLQFAIKADPEKEKIYREALTLDMYLREKCKSRPSFSRSLSEFKKEIYSLERTKLDHIEVFDYSVWKPEAVKLSSPAFLLFDYDNKDPLTGNACLVHIG